MTPKFSVPGLMLSTGLFLTPAGAFADYEAHPANDAVLGLTVVSQSGRPLGYVLDAPVDNEGDIDLIRVAKFHTGETVEQTFDVDVSRVLQIDEMQVIIGQPDVENVAVTGNRIREMGSRS